MEFEEFCATYGEISDKSTGKKSTLVLNGAQRAVLAELESCRKGNRPCRLLILKSRQLGISTLLQYYFTWLLLYHCELETFLSLCHNKQLSKSFITTMMKIYMRVNKDNVPHTVSESVMEDSRGNMLMWGSAKNYNAVRGTNIGIAHLSESAFWHSKSSDWSEEVIRSVMGSVGNRPGTFVVMESTSDGKNNYFYKLWIDSLSGITSYKPIFLCWNLVEYYRKELSDEDRKQLQRLTERETQLVKEGYTLEQLNWYRAKRREFQDEASFLREFPCNAEESFSSSSNVVFSDVEIEECEKHVRRGSLIDLVKLDDKVIKINLVTNYTQWIDVHEGSKKRYFVVVTIGGCVDDSKHNVITCWSWREGDVLELALEKRYVCSLDELIEDSINVARYYDHARLVVEVNTLNKLGLSSKEYYIRKLKKRYSRLFLEDGNVGYMMSYKSKLRGLFSFKRRLREGKIIEHSSIAVEEMKNFVMEEEGVSAGIDSHDDTLLCRLILCDVVDELGPLTAPLNPKEFYGNRYYYYVKKD